MVPWARWYVLVPVGRSDSVVRRMNELLYSTIRYANDTIITAGGIGPVSKQRIFIPDPALFDI